MKVSVVIPTYNRRQSLQRCLSGLERQTFRDFEVVVVDDGSNDDTQIFLAEQKQKIALRFFRQDNKGPAAARNLGIKESSSEYIAFTDDDCIPQSDWLEELVKVLSDNPKVAGVGGFTIRQNNDVISRYTDYAGILSPRSFGEKIIFLLTCNSLYRRSVIINAGCFDERLKYAEDTELATRLLKMGNNFMVAPKAVVKHSHPNTLSKFYKQHFCYGNGIRTMLNEKTSLPFSGSLYPLVKYFIWLPPSHTTSMKKEDFKISIKDKICFFFLKRIQLVATYNGSASGPFADIPRR